MLSSLVIVAVILYFGAAFAYATFISAREWSTLRYLSHYGELVDAKITDLIADKSGRGTSYYIEYEYFDGGNFHHGKQLISRKHYKQFQHQDYVTVRFALTKPNWSRLGKSDFDNTARNMYSYAAFAGCLFFPPFILLWVVSLISTYRYLSARRGEKKK